MKNKKTANKIEAKNIIIATIAMLILIGAIAFVVKRNVVEEIKPTNVVAPVVKKDEPIKKMDVPEITMDQLTEEEVKATNDFAKKVAPKE